MDRSDSCFDLVTVYFHLLRNQDLFKERQKIKLVCFLSQKIIASPKQIFDLLLFLRGCLQKKRDTLPEDSH